MFSAVFKKKDTDAEIREKLLRDLRSAFPSIRRPNNDNSMFELLFEVNKQYITLRIFISADFPTSRPGILLRIYVVELLAQLI